MSRKNFKQFSVSVSISGYTFKKILNFKYIVTEKSTQSKKISKLLKTSHFQKIFSKSYEKIFTPQKSFKL